MNVLYVDNFIDLLVEELSLEGYHPYCVYAHRYEENLEVVCYNGQCILMSKNCFEELATKMRPPKNPNLGKGIIGGILGSIIGIVVWIIIYQLGFIAGITGFIMALLYLRVMSY